MAGALDWQQAFLGVSALLGEPLERALSALGPAHATRTEILAGPLRSAERRERAEAIARIVTAVARELEGARLA